MIRDNPCYLEGIEAYQNGLHVDKDCPHKKDDGNRPSWLLGYYTARTADRLERVFIDMKIDWFEYCKQ